MRSCGDGAHPPEWSGQDRQGHLGSGEEDPSAHLTPRLPAPYFACDLDQVAPSASKPRRLIQGLREEMGVFQCLHLQMEPQGTTPPPPRNHLPLFLRRP